MSRLQDLALDDKVLHFTPAKKPKRRGFQVISPGLRQVRAGVHMAKSWGENAATLKREFQEALTPKLEAADAHFVYRCRPSEYQTIYERLKSYKGFAMAAIAVGSEEVVVISNTKAKDAEPLTKDEAIELLIDSLQNVFVEKSGERVRPIKLAGKWRGAATRYRENKTAERQARRKAVGEILRNHVAHRRPKERNEICETFGIIEERGPHGSFVLQLPPTAGERSVFSAAQLLQDDGKRWERDTRTALILHEQIEDAEGRERKLG